MRILLLPVLCLALASTANAGPAIQAGDIGLRHDIQVLADYGVISGPVTTWPVSWDAIKSDLIRAKGREQALPVAVEQAMERLLARAEQATRRGQPRFEGSLAGAEKPTAIRGFANTPREDAEIRAGFSSFGDLFSIDLNVTGVDNPSDSEDVRLDGSQVGVELGNWTFAASTYERWWGPGWDGSLILSNNARPIPSLAISRNRTDAFETKWLSWIGPWDVSVLFGQFDDPRVINDARFFGMRVNFKPHPSLEIGLSRTAQWCGDGRPCGLDTFWDMFIGRDNIGDQGVTIETEAANQLAGYDIRWSNFWFGQPSAFYTQFIGDDEAGGLPSRFLVLAGIETSGYIRNRWSWRAYAELAGTSCNYLSGDPSCSAYENLIYESGYRYYGRPVGHGADRDAELVSIGFILTGDTDTTWEFLARTGELNRFGVSDFPHSITPTRLDIDSIDLRYTKATAIGTFYLGLGYESLDDPATGESTSDTRGFLRWTSR